MTNLPSSPAVRSALQPFVDEGILAGAVALSASAQGIVSLDCVGFENLSTKAPMQPGSMFWIASQTKPITAAALMMLVDEGKLSIDDPVVKFIPEFANQWLAVEQDEEHILLKKPVNSMTVRHLLTHTNGMPFRSAIEDPTLDFLPLRESVISYTMTPLQSEPGTHVAYSNAGINTAGRLIELLSGVKYVDFMQTRLFDPLGMTDTTFWPNEEQLERLAQPYRPNEETGILETGPIPQLQYPLSNPARTPMAAGGLFSTAYDISRFCRMFLNLGELDGHRYLTEATVRDMTRKQTDDAVEDKVGLGWFLFDDHYDHSGALSSNMSLYPNMDRALIYLVQHAGFAGNGAEARSRFTAAALES